MAKDDRIVKWWNDGCTIGRIAAKLGNPGNLERVIEGLYREKLVNQDCFNSLVKTLQENSDINRHSWEIRRFF